MSWLAETLPRSIPLRVAPQVMLGVDFDAFLADVPGGMRRVLTHFGLPADGHGGRLAVTPVLTQYSKAPEHPYGPAVGARSSTGASPASGGARRGLAWLERIAKTDAVAAAVLDSGAV